MDVRCKKCNSFFVVKNGFIRCKQRYKCKQCKYNFVIGEERFVSDRERKKALCILLYSQGKSSIRFIAKLLKVSKMTILRWIRKKAEEISYPEISKDIKDVEFDEVWHFVKKNLKKYGSLKLWMESQKELYIGCVAKGMLQQLESYIRSSHI
jgi:transposase